MLHVSYPLRAAITSLLASRISITALPPRNGYSNASAFTPFAVFSSSTTPSFCINLSRLSFLILSEKLKIVVLTNPKNNTAIPNPIPGCYLTETIKKLRRGHIRRLSSSLSATEAFGEHAALYLERTARVWPYWSWLKESMAYGPVVMWPESRPDFFDTLKSLDIRIMRLSI